MRTPLWHWIGVLAVLTVEAVGAAILVKRWGKLETFTRYFGIWMVTSALFTIIGILSGKWFGNSQVSSQVWFLFSIAIASGGAASLYVNRRMRSTLKRLVIAYIGVWLLLKISIEPMTGYSRISSPLHALTLLGIGILILSQRLWGSRSSLRTDPTFIIATALVIYAAPTIYLSSIAILLIPTTPHEVLLYYSIRQLFAFLAMGMIAYSLTLQRRLGRRSSWEE